MSFLGEKIISGLTYQQAFDSIAIASIPGDVGGPIDTVVIIADWSGLTPGPNHTLQQFPGGRTSTSSSGLVSTTTTYVNSGDDIHFDMTWDGQTYFGLGNNFWTGSVRAVGDQNIGSFAFTIQFLTLEPIDFTQSLVRVPQALNSSDTSWDSNKNKGHTDLTFTYDNANLENPTSLAILRDSGAGFAFVGAVTWQNGVTSYSYTDYVFATGNYTYKVAAYKYGTPDVISPASSTVVVNYGTGLPAINVVGDLVLAISTSSKMVFISDPSGVYTLVKGKTHDTLYERLPGVTTNDVKIPDPFGKTAFIP